MLARTTGLLAATAALLLAVSDHARADDDWAAKLIARTDTIAAKVAKLRGLALLHPIEKGLMNDDQLRARILARMDEDSPPAERAAEAAAAKRWGLVPWSTDLDKLMVDLLTEQIAGFYDPTERKLYIASRTADPAALAAKAKATGTTVEALQKAEESEADMVMAHEIDHALQDQHFDLDRWTKVVEKDADASAARTAVVEGDAMALMIEYQLAESGQGPPWGQELLVHMMMALMQTTVATGGSGQQFDSAPFAIRQQMVFPYQAGIGFIAALRKTQPWSAVDDVFTKRPPVSTEQVMHPELYLSDEQPDLVTAAPPPKALGLAQLDSQTWGEAGWLTFLQAHGVVPETAATAAAGWGGDRVVLLGPSDGTAHPERTTAVALVTWDSEADGLEAWDALGKALEQMVIGTPLVADDNQLRWLDADGRVTAAERRHDRIVIVVGAPLGQWRALVDAAWSWKVKPGKP
ncbi:MAG TPA: hypothetical protein VHE35_23245 [Kofleriaceae bacterium]|nr:hypothetical protein [Kofleriaceae bacterium]